MAASTSASRRTVAADLLRRANREGCTLLLGTRRVDKVCPSTAAVVVREGMDQKAVVVVGVVVAIALM